jgi:DNA topoisomerase-1
MAKSLVIVESPAKAKTIEKYLGPSFKVVASYGHVRSLPSKDGSVDVDHDFTPVYEVLEEKKKYIDRIKAEMKGVDKVYLATDLDREGEAIAWHLATVLGIDNGDTKGVAVHRVVFSEVTKDAIKEAFANPRTISKNLVDAQQARVILDYLVGFNLSPLLWKKIRYRLSAGRVQSVALRIICEREREIEAFTPREFWTVEGIFTKQDAYDPFSATLISRDGKKYGKFDITDEAGALAVVDALERAAFAVDEVRRKDVKRTPPPPFITSTLQQEASRKLGFFAKKTMDVAQKLYEGKEIGDTMVGLITYMRTDSVQMAASALAEARQVITGIFGESYALEKPRFYRGKTKGAQEAHEAIRPTSLGRTPDSVKKYLSKDELRLYELIWKRTIASQMAEQILDSVSVDIASDNGYTFRATGYTIKFPGFAKVYLEGTDDEAEDSETKLPALAPGDPLTPVGIVPEQHFTTPPPRYSEATLIKALEEYGIGRPSTYAGIINTLKTRQYVTLKERRFFPEDIGMVVNDLLVAHFNRYVDYGFTAHMEQDLDNIAAGQIEWRPMIKNFWEPFNDLIIQKDKEIKKSDITTQPTDKTCPLCGKPVVIKLGRYGRFYACSGYPACRYVAPLETDEQEIPATEEICEKCGKPMQVKRGRYGPFLGCTGYPDCKNIKSLKKVVDSGVTCPECSAGTLIERRSSKGRTKGRVFYGCSRYPDCKYIVSQKPFPKPCPKCGSPFMTVKEKKGDDPLLVCPAEGCGYSEHFDVKKESGGS